IVSTHSVGTPTDQDAATVVLQHSRNRVRGGYRELVDEYYHRLGVGNDIAFAVFGRGANEAGDAKRHRVGAWLVATVGGHRGVVKQLILVDQRLITRGLGVGERGAEFHQVVIRSANFIA